jgi:hypothetical protein
MSPFLLLLLALAFPSDQLYNGAVDSQATGLPGSARWKEAAVDALEAAIPGSAVMLSAVCRNGRGSPSFSIERTDKHEREYDDTRACQNR